MDPLFSIIIPTYNAGKTLDIALKSITAQTLTDFEILIMDGGSSDDTVSLAESYHSDRIKIVSEKDKGIYDAMNKAVQLAKGTWVYFMGSDDAFYDNNVLAQIKSYSLQKESDIIYGNSMWLPESKVESGEWGYKKLLGQSINHQRIFYKKSLFDRLGLFDISYTVAADYALNIRFFCTPGIRLQYVDLIIANYHSGGFSANKIDDKFWQNWNATMLKPFKPHLPPKEIYGRLGWYSWHKLQQKQYGAAAGLFTKVFFNTFSVGYLKHTASQVLKAVRKK